MKKKPNLLVLGASGGLANAFLHYMINHRGHFDKLVLIDQNKEILSNNYLDHKGLSYQFYEKKIDFPKDESMYIRLLKDHKINIVLDLTDSDSVPIMEATNKAGISYVNTAMNDDKKNASELIFYIYAKKNIIKKAPHILCSGMNPGIVNMWVRCGIEKYGIPREIIHFEYDTSVPAIKWKPALTWSPHEFFVENVRDPGGVALGRGKIKQLFPNAIKNKIQMKSILHPVIHLQKYPMGSLVLHEENITIAQKYNIPSKFIYAIDERTMKIIHKFYSNHKSSNKQKIFRADNTMLPLDGSDNIGVILDYPDKKIYYFNTESNLAVRGTNATYFQVVIGIFSALFTLLFDNLKGGIYFTEDLYYTYYKSFLFDNMRVQELLFRKSKHKLELARYIPDIKIKRNKHFEHIFL